MIPKTIPRIPLPVLLGDVVFTHWPGFSAKLTMWVTNGGAAHQEQISDDGAVPKVLSASTFLNSMREWKLDDRLDYFKRTKTEWARFTPVPAFTEEQRDTLCHYFGEAFNSYIYSRGELGLQAVDAVKNWLFRIPYDSARAVTFRRWGNLSRGSVICSKLVNQALVRVGMLPEWSQFWSPADTLNKLISSTSWAIAEATDGFFEPTIAVREDASDPLPPPLEMAPAVPVTGPPVTMEIADDR